MRELVEKITNFKVINNSLSNGQFIYINWESEMSEKVKKIKKRDEVISDLLGEEPSEIDINKIWGGSFDDVINTFSPRISSVNLVSKPLTSWDLVYDDLINYLNSNSHHKMGDLDLSNLIGTVNKRIISKIITSCNYISHSTRIGPGNVVIMNNRVASLLSKEIPTIDLIIDNRIDDNKVIILRRGVPTDIGFLFQYDEVNNRYFHEKIECNKCIVQFSIKGL